ncbi:MAG: lysophospholipid acyltransferase family protein [Planctomycetota bacterium]|nr:lysophospholipid acyltransferase family protein [Planctomycetota bacterium]
MKAYAEYLLLRCILFLAGLLPASCAVAFGRTLAAVWFAFDAKHRRKILFDIERTPLAKRSEAEKRELVRGVYRHFGTMFGELAKFRRWDFERISKCIDDTELDKLRGREHPNGCMIISAHLGNWELTGMTLPLFGVDVWSVARPLKNKYIDRLLNESRVQFGQHIMEKFNVMLEIVRHLKKGRTVAVVIDQDAEKDAIFVPFLGETAGTLTIHAKLALKYDLPVYCVVTHRLRPFRHRFRVVGPVDYPSEGDDALERTVRKFNDVLSEVISECPEQWMWFHHRWRTADKKGLTRVANERREL